MHGRQLPVNFGHANMYVNPRSGPRSMCVCMCVRVYIAGLDEGRGWLRVAHRHFLAVKLGHAHTCTLGLLLPKQARTYIAAKQLVCTCRQTEHHAAKQCMRKHRESNPCTCTRKILVRLLTLFKVCGQARLEEPHQAAETIHVPIAGVLLKAAAAMVEVRRCDYMHVRQEDIVIHTFGGRGQQQQQQ